MTEIPTSGPRPLACNACIGTRGSKDPPRIPSQPATAARAAVRSWVDPGRTTDTHSGKPLGSLSTWTDPPWR
jgi:hypothetical protein